jgi:hypothetical protein
MTTYNELFSTNQTSLKLSKKLDDDIEAQIIQSIYKHNPDLIYSGNVVLADAQPTHSANKTYFATETGTMWGISVVKGQIIIDTGNVFYAKNINSLILNIDNKSANGNFEKGTAGYGYFCTASLENTTFKIGSQSLKGTSTGGRTSFFKSTPATAGHRYYFGLWTKNGNIDDYEIQIYGASVIYDSPAEIITDSEWVYRSFIIDAPLTETIYFRSFWGANTGDYRYFDGIMLVDLTASFGTDTPSNEDFTNIIHNSGNYFGDSYQLSYPNEINSVQSQYAKQSSIASMTLAVVDIDNDSVIFYSKLGKDKTVFWEIRRAGINDIMQLYRYGWFYNKDSFLPKEPTVYDTIFTYGAGSDFISPININAVSGGDAGTSDFTGGNHDIGGQPTAKNDNYSILLDGINISQSGSYYCKNAFVSAVNSIKGYNTMDSGRYIVKNNVNYTIYDGQLDVDSKLIPLEDVSINLYYGLQCWVNNAFDEIQFVSGENPGKQPLTFNLNSGVKTLYPSDSVIVSKDSDKSLELFIDYGISLGNRENILDTSYYYFTSGNKVYAMLIDIPQAASIGDLLHWKGYYKLIK